jgi:hypothetical protein
MITILVLLALLPISLAVSFFADLFELLAGLFILILRVILFFFLIGRFVVSRRAIPLPQRNLTRATIGAFVVTFCTIVSNSILLNDPRVHVLESVAAVVAAIYVWVGYRGSLGIARDPMAVIWWSCGAACSVTLLIYAPRTTMTAHVLAQAVACAVVVACALRVWLLLRPVPGVKLPHPSTIPGMPMAGPASVGAAHTALGRGGQSARPKFRT